ncbi:MAG: hypothetical protein RIF46_00245, partial [Cyclobacteriaceae bacterium]
MNFLIADIAHNAKLAGVRPPACKKQKGSETAQPLQQYLRRNALTRSKARTTKEASSTKIPSLASSDKTNESAGASKVSNNHCVQKDEKPCEMSQVESTDLSQRLIHGEVRTDTCKVAVGAFV